MATITPNFYPTLKLDPDLEHDLSILEKKFEHVKDLKYKREFKRAKQILQELIARADEFCLEDEWNIYRSYGSPMEWLLLGVHYPTDKHVFNLPLPVDGYHRCLGEILTEEDELEKAEEELHIALQWNPVSFDTYIDCAMIYAAKHELDSMMWQLRLAHRYAYKPEQFAWLLQCWGAKFVEQEELEAMWACQALASRYDPFSASGMVTRQMGVTDDMSQSRIEELAEKYGFPTEPDLTVVDKATYIGRYCINSKLWEAAEYFLHVAYDLTKDESLRQYLDMIPNER